MRKKQSKIGVWAFIIGLILAGILAVFAPADAAWVVTTIAVLGALVGFFNVTESEVEKFLVAAIGFLISFQALSSVIQTLAFGWTAVGKFFSLMVVFMAPATAVVAVIALYKIAKD